MLIVEPSLPEMDPKTRIVTFSNGVRIQFIHPDLLGVISKGYLERYQRLVKEGNERRERKWWRRLWRFVTFQRR